MAKNINEEILEKMAKFACDTGLTPTAIYLGKHQMGHFVNYMKLICGKYIKVSKVTGYCDTPIYGLEVEDHLGIGYTEQSGG